MKWEAWYYDYINGDKKVYIYVEADSLSEAINKARRIDLRVIAARAINAMSKPATPQTQKPYKHSRTR